MSQRVRRTRFRSLTIIGLIAGTCLALNLWYNSGFPKLRLVWPNEEANAPFFVKKHHFDCQALIQERSKPDQRVHTRRPVVSEYKTWQTVKDCETIRRRNFYPTKPNSDQEAEFPLAYVIMVDDNLEQLETLFNAIYTPQNYYCFHVDFKAHFMVHDFVTLLGQCFDKSRVFVADQSVPIAATSVSVLFAQRACLLKLITASKRSRAWRYALTIDGSDFPLRTNREIVEILSLHEGANDVELVEPLSYRYEKLHRPVTDQYGQPTDMEETTLSHGVPPLPNLKIYKGSIASALSAPFVHFLLMRDESVKLLSWLARTYMPSEIFVSTMNHNEPFNAPGGYPGWCVKNKKRKAWVSRFTVWNTYKQFQCHGEWTKGRCIFGVADLPTLDTRPELFAHAFDLRTSAVAVDCQHERIFNRTHKQKDLLEHLQPHMHYYRNLSAVRYEKWKRQEDQENVGRFVCVTCDDCDH